MMTFEVNKPYDARQDKYHYMEIYFIEMDIGKLS